jgi:hypothetical protein
MAPKNNKAEQKALKLIFDAGEEGLLQSELWKLLDVSSREGSRMAKKFEEKGRVYREKILNNGRWTYMIFSKKELVTLDSIEGCPCLVCDEVEKCFNEGKVTPTACLKLTAWIDPRIEMLPPSEQET